MRSYLFGIIAAAGILGIVSGLTNPKSAAGGLIRMIGGLYLMFVVIQPLAHFDFDALADYAEQKLTVGMISSDEGENHSRAAMAGIIKRECESYIMDKALACGIALQVEVHVTEDEIPVPDSVVLYGTAFGHQKQNVEQFIEEDLNIPKEKQKWTGTS